jgi:hypothetical protein
MNAISGGLLFCCAVVLGAGVVGIGTAVKVAAVPCTHKASPWVTQQETEVAPYETVTCPGGAEITCGQFEVIPGHNDDCSKAVTVEDKCCESILIDIKLYPPKCGVKPDGSNGCFPDTSGGGQVIGQHPASRIRDCVFGQNHADCDP